MVDKDAKMRDMKRQNVLLNSKIKLLEEEMENLHEKIDHTLKERNKLRKEVHMGINQISEPISRSISPAFSIGSAHGILNNGTGAGTTAAGVNNSAMNSLNNFGSVSSNTFIEPFKTSSISSHFYSPSTFLNSWDRYKLNDPITRSNNQNTTAATTVQSDIRPSVNGATLNGHGSNNHLNGHGTAFDLSINSFLTSGTLINDYNSANTTPRSFR